MPTINPRMQAGLVNQRLEGQSIEKGHPNGGSHEGLEMEQ